MTRRAAVPSPRRARRRAPTTRHRSRASYRRATRQQSRPIRWVHAAPRMRQEKRTMETQGRAPVKTADEIRQEVEQLTKPWPKPPTPTRAEILMDVLPVAVTAIKVVLMLLAILAAIAPLTLALLNSLTR